MNISNKLKLSKRIKSFLFNTNLALLILITLNIWILILTKGYEISLGVLKVSSHRAGRLFIVQIILVVIMRVFFYKKITENWKKAIDSKTPEFFPTRSTIIITLLIILTISIVAYYRTLSGYFLSDDFEFLNLFSKSGFLNFDILFNYFKQFGLMRPLSFLSLHIDYFIWKLNPLGFHLTSLAIHVLNSFLIFFIFFLIIKEKYISMLSAFLFSVYPLHLESVVWISGRFDILCTFFYLLSILFFLIVHKDNRRFSLFYVISLVAFVFALFSKEMAITLPLTIILFDLFLTSKSKFPNIKTKLKIHYPYWLILICYFILRIGILKNLGGYFYPEGNFLLFQENLYYNIKHLFLRPFGPLFIPLNASLFSNFVIIKNCILFILSSLIFLIPFRRKLNFKLLCFGLLFIFITVLPLFKIFYISETLEGSRFLYLSSICACLIIATLLKISYPKKENVRKGLNIIIPFLLIILLIWGNVRNSTTWIKASEISEKMSYQAVEKIQGIKSKTVIYAINLPDNYEGAYIFRNGFSSSLDLHGKPDFLRVLDIKKIKKNQLGKKSYYIVLDWKEDKFNLYSLPYAHLVRYMKE